MSYDGEPGVSAAEVRRGGFDRFEIVLWVFGLALIAAALVAFSYAADPSSANLGMSCSGDSCTAPPGYALRQFSYSMAPGVLTGGIVCVGLALAVRVLSRAFGRALLSIPGQDTATVGREHTPRGAVVPEAVWSGDPDDQRIFMRPGD